MESNLWFFYAVVTMLFWGVWGAFIERPEKNGFPATLGLRGLGPHHGPLRGGGPRGHRVGPRARPALGPPGSAAGLLGAAGQLVLFDTLRRGPAYLVFPVISLSPVVSVLLSVLLLGETASPRAWAGIVLALLAMPLLSYQPPTTRARSRDACGSCWRSSSSWPGHPGLCPALRQCHHEEREHLLLHDAHGPAARAGGRVDDGLHEAHQLGPSGPWLAAPIQLLNSIGALTMVYAFRHGKVIIVSPMINALAPVITIVLSLLLYRVIPHRVVVAGMALAAVAFYLMA